MDFKTYSQYLPVAHKIWEKLYPKPTTTHEVAQGYNIRGDIARILMEKGEEPVYYTQKVRVCDSCESTQMIDPNCYCVYGKYGTIERDIDFCSYCHQELN